MFRFVSALTALSLVATPVLAQKAPKDTGEAQFRALYKELVETNTTFSAGDCTLAAQRMADRLKAAGFADNQLTVFAPAGRPKDGGLVAVLPGKDPKAKAILLLAHIDVVEAKREDWERDPFTLVEENGYFYARGASDDKAQASIWTDLIIRFKREGYTPRRTVKVALTCGEEGGGHVNGARWLAQNKRDLIDAAFALNEGAGGNLDAQGKRIAHTIQAGEKSSFSFKIEATNPGGHSSRPVPDNAIYELSKAISRVQAYEFPVQMNDTTRAFFTRMAPIVGGEQGAAMTAIVANPNDKAARAVLSRDANNNAILGTTCIPTMIQGGHAQNALPQRATVTVNCRIFPGEGPAQVRDTLIKVVGDAKVTVGSNVAIDRVDPKAAPPLTPAVVGPIEKVSQAMWPGVPVVPVLQAGGTDAPALIAVGIPTYGVSGIFYDPDLGRLHGLNERIGVSSLMEAREFSYRLVKVYAEQKD